MPGEWHALTSHELRVFGALASRKFAPIAIFQVRALGAELACQADSSALC